MTTQAAAQTEPTTHLPCRRCGRPVEMAVWVLDLVGWPELRGKPWCGACRAARQHARQVAAREQEAAQWEAQQTRAWQEGAR